MTNIEQLYNHIKDLTKQNVDNILVDMISYGANSNTPVIDTDLIIYALITDWDNAINSDDDNLFAGSNMTIDWGDNTTPTEYTEGNQVVHEYSNWGGVSVYKTIRVSGVTDVYHIKDFDEMIQFKYIVIPPTVNSVSLDIGDGANDNLDYIEFTATSSEDVPTVNLDMENTECAIVIPNNCTNIYTSVKGYPTEYLVEKSDFTYPTYQ